MVCYARPAIRMAALVLIAFLIFARPVGHFFDAAALVVAIGVAVAVGAALAAVACAVFLSTRRRRARAGGCVSCTLRCQHAMTEGTQRLRLVRITDRSLSTSPAAPSASSPPTAAPVAAGVRAVVPAGRSLPVVSINGRPSPSASPSPGNSGPARRRSRSRATPVGRSSRWPSPGRPELVERPAGRPALVPLPAAPDDDPRWPDRPARRVPERVGS
jgi:hypothetical protein